MKPHHSHRPNLLWLWMVFSLLVGSAHAFAFTSGQRVQCNGTNVRVRTSTDTSSDANLIGYVNTGDLGNFQSGPVVTGGHNWYYVKWDRYSSAGYTADYVQAAPAAAAPSVSGINPNAVTGSTTARTFTISGASFVSGATVQVGFRDNNYTFTNTGTAATFNSSSQLTVPITTGTTADTWNVRVKNPDGQTSNTITFRVSALVVSNPAPVVNSISPNVVTGSNSAQTFTVYGSNFVSGAKVQVAFSGNGYSFVNTSTNASFINAGQLTVPITTSTQADSWKVRVINPDAQTSNQVSLTVNAPVVNNPGPVLSAINPASVVGATSPQTFTLMGSNFASGATVQVAYAGNGYSFVNTNTAAAFVGSTQLTVPITTSTQTDTWQVRVRNADGQTSNTINLTVTSPPANNPAPVVSGISPSSVVGSTSAQTVTVTGSNFVSGAKVQVAYKANSYTFVSTNTAATFVSGTQLTVPITTSTQADTWQVRVLNPDAQTSNAVNLVVTAPVSTNPAPVVNAISPASVVGSSAAQAYTVVGSNFVTGAVVQVAYKGNSYSFVNTNTAATFVSGTQLTVPITTSIQADTWQVRVVNPDTQTSNAVSLTVTAPPTANPAPVLAAVNPGTVVGSASPQTFTLTGSNFVRGAIVQVGFAGNNYTFVSTNTASSYVSTTQLTVPITTATQADTWNVRVHNPDGQVSNVLTFKVTTVATATGPTLSGISPGTVTGSTTPHNFVVQGTGFVNGAVVQVAFHDNGYQFQNTSTAATLTSASQLTVPINTGTTVDTWQVRVRNPDGGISNVVNFQVAAASGNLTLTGPTSIAPNSSGTFRVMFGQTDVTDQATLSFAQAVPSYAGIGGSSLLVYRTAPPGTTLAIQAQYRNSTTQLTSPAFTVTIPANLAADFRAAYRAADGETYLVSLDGSASGGVPPYTYRWDTNNDGTYGDVTGPSVGYAIGRQGGGYPFGLQVTDAAGGNVQVLHQLTVAKPPVDGEPGGLKLPPDTRPSGYYSASGESIVFDDIWQKRSANGLLVITHGIRAKATDAWLGFMAQDIEARLGDSCPNIVLYDWRDGANITLDADGREKVEALLEDVDFDVSWLNDFTSLAVRALEKAFRVDDFLEQAVGSRFVEGPLAGIKLAQWILDQKAAGSTHVNAARPIHLIGHSAGGFCMGTCASVLKLHGVLVDRVTMLDTPAPIYWEVVAQMVPGYVDQYISSLYGALTMPPLGEAPLTSHHSIGYHFDPDGSILKLIDPSDTGHGYSHYWYRTTITDGMGDGFDRSPFRLGPKVSRNAAQMAAARASAAIESTDQPITGFSAFGTVTGTAGGYQLTEVADAGLKQEIVLPAGAVSLKFRYKFVSGGDGDMLSVNWADLPPIYAGEDLPLAESDYVEAVVPLDFVKPRSGTLVFTLVSRGVANAVIDIEDIRFGMSDDPDGDDLTNAQEAAYGTDPLKADTDGDGVNDGAEVAARTNPLDPASFPAQAVTAPAVWTVILQAAPSSGGSAVGGGTYLSGSVATVTAVPNAGYAFTGWTENGAAVDANAVYAFTVSGDRNLVANFAPAASDFDETLDFNDNQTPAGWTIETAEGTANANASVANGRFEVRQVDNYVGIQRDKSVPAAATQIKVEYDGNVSSNYWGQGTQIHLITTDGVLYKAFIGKAGYGGNNISVGVEKSGSTPLPLNVMFPLDTGTYHVTAVFSDGQVVYTATKQGATAPLFYEVVSVPNLLIHAVQTVRMYGTTTTGDPSWIDNVSMVAVFPAGAGSAAVTVQGNPANAGTVSGGGSLPVGSTQTVTTRALSGWTFAGWGDGDTSNPRSFVVAANGTAFIANFVQQTAPLNLQATPPEGGTVSGNGTFQVGTTHQVSATVTAGWNFAGWSDGITVNPRNVVVPSGGVSYTANFTAIVTATPTPEPTPVVSPTPTPEPTPVVSPTPTPEPTPVSSPTPEPTPIVDPTPTPIPSPSLFPSPTATPTQAPASVVTSPPTATGRVGVPFTYQITADNHPTSFAASPLGGGLTVDSATGLISGTPTTPGTFPLIVIATNADGSGPGFSLTLTISAVVPSVSMTVGDGSAAVEGGPAGIVVISRTGDTHSPLTIFYKVKSIAQPGRDYKKLLGAVTIPAGATKAKIKVKAVDGSPNADTLALKLKLLPPEDGSYVFGIGTVKMKLIGK